MDKTRLALIGVGMIGKRHLKAMRDVAEAELAALVDMVPGVSGLAKEWSVPFFESTDSMLKEIAPDGIIVCTPTEVHLEPVLQSLDAGAHVLVEKPITASLEEARQIIEKASATRKQVLVGHHRRHYGILHKTKQLLN
ncbi:MAG: Gfo/Idh/MocA family oxidoreductase, partial [SAR324 cluster bacterium]|nr:Gfo/Idh/MocA family oxidoreductase [SAR324 cluster bacterium]